MRRQSHWLKEYGIWVKLGLVCLFFISLGGLNIINFCIGEIKSSNSPSYNTKLDDWTRPPTYEGPEFETWKTRKEVAQKEIEPILAEAQAKNRNCTLYDYFREYNQLMDIEDKYNFFLTAPSLSPLEQLVNLCGSRTSEATTSEQVKFINGVRKRMALRRGDAPPGKPGSISASQIFSAFFEWFWPRYLLLMLFWFLIYIIRFEERTQSRRKFQMHHHDGNYFFEAQEPFPGQLSLKNELIICPWRLLSRVLLWPFYCFAYPHFENTAEGIRYVRAKARLLQGKPFGYQLTVAEDAWLKWEARQPVKEFEKTLKQLSEFEVPQLVRKSLLTAYMSLLFGILLQPAILLAATHSHKVAKHFYGQVQIVQIEQNSQHQLDGPDPPSHDDWQLNFQAVLPSPIDLQSVFNLLVKIALEFWVRLPILVFDIDHVPLNSLV